MTDDLLERISRLEHVTSLELNGSTEITDDGLRHLARLRHLQHLDLGGCRVSDRGLAVLAELPELRSISLSWTGRTDAGVAHLAHCPLLERVNLMHTRTGDGAVRALAGHAHLRHFKSGAQLTDAGMALFRDFPVFRSWQGGDEQTDGNTYRAGAELPLSSRRDSRTPGSPNSRRSTDCSRSMSTTAPSRSRLTGSRRSSIFPTSAPSPSTRPTPRCRTSRP